MKTVSKPSPKLRKVVEKKLKKYGISMALQKKIYSPPSQFGKAQLAWTGWTIQERRIILLNWCKPPREYTKMFQGKDWFQLPLYIKKSIKRLVRLAKGYHDPIFSNLLPKEKENATP